MSLNHTNRICIGQSCAAAKNRTGAALIMVLGLLTVMVMMAVAFAITMRTERLAAGNFADTVRARELVHVALGRALSDLSSNLGPVGLRSPGGRVYPPWIVTNYTAPDPLNPPFKTNTFQDLRLVKGSVTNYIPALLFEHATNADALFPAAHWIAIESVNTDASLYGPGTNLMGRVAYLIINCSGLLDANYAGSGNIVPRRGGTNPLEIVIGALGEMNFEAPASVNNSLAFYNQRKDDDIRYETLAHFNAKAPIFNKPSSNFFVYSRGLPGYWDRGWNCAATQVNLAGSVANLREREAYITNAFFRAGLSQVESGMLYSNLIDYVDSDHIPSNMEFCVEAVPMINEIVVTNTITVTTLPGPIYRYNIEGAVEFECWYPFATNSYGAFRLSSQVSFSEANGVKPDNLPLAAIPLDIPVERGSCPRIRRPFAKSVDLGSLVSPVTLATSIDSLRMEYSGATVDRLNAPAVLTNINPCAVGAPQTTVASLECLDPRLNSNPGDTNLWYRYASHSLGFDNRCTVAYLLVPGNDGFKDMFVANNPLSSVAELGFLMCSQSPWQTVKLYGPNASRVVDTCGMSPDTNAVLVTNVVFLGRMNCNPNLASNAAAAIFVNMPVDEFPGDHVAFGLAESKARSFVSALFNNGAGGFTNVSDIGRCLLNAGDFPDAASLNEFERESYFRNTLGLINLRQNMFTIILEAHAASGGNIPGNPARQRAVAIVWRDPYTGEMSVRNIKWLDD